MTKNCEFHSNVRLNGKVYSQLVKTRIGLIQIAANSRGIVRINLSPREKKNSSFRLIPPDCKKNLEHCKNFLKDFVSGRAPSGKRKVVIDWSSFTRFQTRVYQCLAMTRFGEVLSYSQLAARCGCPRADRAVGNALKRNPVPLLVPCHRVIRKNGLLGGFFYGTQLKKQLLKSEGVIQNQYGKKK